MVNHKIDENKQYKCRIYAKQMLPELLTHRDVYCVHEYRPKNHPHFRSTANVHAYLCIQNSSHIVKKDIQISNYIALKKFTFLLLAIKVNRPSK